MHHFCQGKIQRTKIKVPSPTPEQLPFNDEISPTIDEISFLEGVQNSSLFANDSDLVLLEDSSESAGIPPNFSCPEILPPPEMTQTELFAKIFDVMTGKVQKTKDYIFNAS